MSTPQGHHEIILVADDDEANRELLSTLLSAEGYKVVCPAILEGKCEVRRFDLETVLRGRQG